MNDLHLADDTTLDAALRHLDAAQPTLTDTQRARADALLASLTGPDAHAPASVTPITVRSRRRRIVRWLVPAAAASVLVAGSLILPGLPTTPEAYADWTPTPTPVAEPLLSRAADGCRARMADWERGSGGADRPIVRAESARVVLAEQRGSHVFLALATDTGAEAQCLADGTGTVWSTTGSAPTAQATLPTVEPTGLTGGSVGLSLEGSSGYAYTQGLVGDLVRGVTIHAAGQTLTATVANGRYAAWWPVTGVDPLGRLPEDVSLDVTLADGTVLTDVETDATRALGPRPGPTEVGRVAYGGGVEGNRTVRTVEGLVGERVRAIVVHAGDRDLPAEVVDGAFAVRWPVDRLPTGDVPEATFTLILDDGTVLEHVTAIP